MKTNDQLIDDLKKIDKKYTNKEKFLELTDLSDDELKEFNFKEDDFILIKEGDWIYDHKYQYKEDIYQYVPTQQYVCVSNCRSGSYHTDWYYQGSDICLVNKVEKTVVVTTWEAIK